MPRISTRIPQNMAQALKRYEGAATDVLQSFIKTVEAKPPPRMLFHYTDGTGLRGIVEQGTLWLSDIFGLNDPSELRHGLKIAIDILKSRVIATRPEIDLFARQFERFDIDGGIEAAGHFFICSFSADGDDLGQWRAYADNGRGFALGFETATLEDGFCRRKGKPIPQHATFHLTYSDRKLTRIEKALADLIDPLISLPRSTVVRGDALHAYMMDVLTLHAMNVIRGVMFFKHPAYKNETEFRFQQLFRRDRPAPAVKYRQRELSLVRYREFDWRAAAPHSLKNIIIGPAAEQANAARFVRDCLTAFHANANDVKIVRSTIPYRAR